jgi:hypothetical protein
MNDHPPSPTDPEYRYTLQLFDPDVYDHPLYLTRNVDAIFPDNVDVKQLPHPVIMHYVYGCAAVKRWAIDPKARSQLMKHDKVFEPKQKSSTPRLQCDEAHFDRMREQNSKRRYTVSGQPTGGAGDMTSEEAQDIVYMLSFLSPRGREYVERRHQEREDHNARISSWVRDAGHGTA